MCDVFGVVAIIRWHGCLQNVHSMPNPHPEVPFWVSFNSFTAACQVNPLFTTTTTTSAKITLAKSFCIIVWCIMSVSTRKCVLFYRHSNINVIVRCVPNEYDNLISFKLVACTGVSHLEYLLFPHQEYCPENSATTFKQTKSWWLDIFRKVLATDATNHSHFRK